MKLFQIFEEKDPFGPTIFPQEVTDMIAKIKAECGDFLKEGIPLWRGLHKRNATRGLLIDQPSVVDRQPRNTDIELHKILDRVLEPLAGFKPRSEALFCYTDRRSTEFYGQPYLVFPKGEFDSVYLHDVTDLYAQADWMLKDGADTTDEEAHAILEPLVRRNDLAGAAAEDEAPEIMVHSLDGFYLVNFKLLDEMLDHDLSDAELVKLFFGEPKKKTKPRKEFYGGPDDDDDF